MSIDEQIRRAMEEGKFDNLPGKGKPLQWEENPNEDPDWALAHHLLKSSGYTLPWIEARHALEADLEVARGALRRAWEWRRLAPLSGQPQVVTQAEWERAILSFRREIETINRRIFSYNLSAPLPSFHLRRLDFAGEIRSITDEDDTFVAG